MERFDELARAAGRATSRRRALAILAAGAAAVAVPTFFRRSAAASTTGASQPAAAAALACQESNFIAPSSYDELESYAFQCGIRCPFGNFVPGAIGCTQISYAPDPPVLGTISWSQGPFGDGWCASRPVTVNWRVYFNGYTSLKLIPWNACCQAECEAELNGWMNDTDVHEQAHVDRQSEVIARANVDWINRVVSGCGTDRAAALKQLAINISADIRAANDAIDLTIASDPEPYSGPRPDRATCTSAMPGARCVNGTCQMCVGQTCPQAVGWNQCCPPSDPHCCEQSCCPEPYSVCCGGGTNACCTTDHPVCVWDPDFGVICGRAGARVGAAKDGARLGAGKDGPDFVPARINPKHKPSARK